MRLLPVIERELRASARQPFTYWLRVIGVGWLALGIGVAWLLLSHMHGTGGFSRIQIQPQDLGVTLFGTMNLAMFLALGLLAPLLTADSISRERREGTLGLMFLTPLRPLDIVLGKSMAAVLKGLTLYVTMLPWLMVPVLLGGVGSADFSLAALLNGGVLMLGLSAGILASACCRDAARATLLAEFLGVALLAAFLVSHQALFRGLVMPFLGGGAGVTSLGIPDRSSGFFGIGPGFYARGGLLIYAQRLLRLTTSSEEGFDWRAVPGGTSPWSHVWAALPAGGGHLWHQAAALLLLACVAVALLIAWIAARSVRGAWVEQPPSAAVEAARRRLLAPRFLPNLLRRRLSRCLERNPIGWLHQRSPQARMAKWGWFAAVALVESATLSDSGWRGGFQDLLNPHHLTGMALLAGMAFSAAGSFRHERENGAIELLLICPFSTRRLVWGRLRGIWAQFLPSLALLMAIQLVVSWATAIRVDHEWGVFYAGCFLTVPVVGLWFSMQRWHLLAAALLTCLVSLVLPLLTATLATLLLSYETVRLLDPDNARHLWMLFQGGLGLIAFSRLNQALVQRRFALK